ncbi:hypothetical protein CHLRE_02g143187v5 [Chlamydomonas reinhardtii]|uniref:Uncharacterized protein n=1 Tax=Chlamydomonas reinhardtii TaxID=3055 RepID=A0A2K3E4P9_CHLRE|nr:uncharacterized protein CHLRE_02g143187v5 [Chlamydomonas reinhardtii]PNW87707.1 hypothetical protein CHLRE_02g143187v5 [Chlamydomonas reinhardtii]
MAAAPTQTPRSALPYAAPAMSRARATLLATKLGPSRPGPRPRPGPGGSPARLSPVSIIILLMI